VQQSPGTHRSGVFLFNESSREMTREATISQSITAMQIAVMRS
jgi:hypothetical protein